MAPISSALRSVGTSCTIRRVSVGASRSISSTVARRRDYVQELYLSELKSYKPAPLAKDAHVGNVKEFHAVAAPQAPEIFSSQDIASQLQEWDQEVAPDVTVSPTSSEDAAGQSADEFLAFLESREPEVLGASHH